jgi:uncharacterized cupin superfamily protein
LDAFALPDNTRAPPGAGFRTARVREIMIVQLGDSMNRLLFASALMLTVAAPAIAADKTPSIVPIVNDAQLTDHGKYTGVDTKMSPASYDGSWKGHTEYDHLGNGLSVALWASDPGTLKIDGYPYDEYALIIKGDLVITDAAHPKGHAFHAGDTFMIPKGWAGIWSMKTAFLKQTIATSADVKKYGH